MGTAAFGAAAIVQRLLLLLKKKSKLCKIQIQNVFSRGVSGGLGLLLLTSESEYFWRIRICFKKRLESGTGFNSVLTDPDTKCLATDPVNLNPDLPRCCYRLVFSMYCLVTFTTDRLGEIACKPGFWIRVEMIQIRIREREKGRDRDRLSEIAFKPGFWIRVEMIQILIWFRASSPTAKKPHPKNI